MAQKLTENQIKLLRYLFEINRGVPRRMIVSALKLNPTSLQFAIWPPRGERIVGAFIDIKRDKHSDIISLTKAGRQLVKAFKLAYGA